MNIFILNRNEEIVQVLSDSAEKTACHFFNSTLVVELNKGSNFTFEVDALNEELLEHIKEENFVVVPYDGSEYKLFIIREIVDIHSDSLIKEVYCEDASIELADEIILESFTDKVEIVDALKSMLKDTRWTSGIVDDTYIRQLTEEYKSRSVLDAIYTLASEYNVEVDFSVEFTGNTITGRKVNIKRAFGRTLGKRFESSKDITSLKRTIQTGDIKTAIIPYGKTNEETGEVLTIKNVVWEASQNPMDKPVGQIFLEDKEATEVWGYTGVNGKKRPRWFAVHFDEVEDENELIKLAHLQLKRMTTPKVSYEVEALDLFRLLGHEEASHEEVKLGDLVNIVDHEFTPALTLTSRVVKIEHDLNNPANTKFTLGNIVESIVDKDLKTQLQELNYKVGAIQNKVDLSDIENRLDNIETNISSGRFEDINELNNLLFGQSLGYHYIEGENGLWIYDRPKDQRPTKVVAIKGGMIGLGQWDSQLQKWKIGTFIDGTNVNASMITTGTLSADRIEAGTLDINKLNVALRSKIAEIDGKASTGYVDTKISTAVDSINLSVSSKYATKSETESLKTSAVTESKKYSDTKKAEAISEAVSTSKSYADTKKAEAIVQAGKDTDSKVATAKTELNGKIDSKANKTDVYTKTQTYTKSETDSAIKVAKDSIELGVSNKYETKTNVTNKINSAKTEAINSAVSTSKSYADTKKTEAITQAGKDADSKVNSAKTELNNKIDLKASKTDVYTKSETYTKTETDSKIKVAKDEINLSVSNNYETKTNVENKISTAVSKIQIGGRNLAYKETIKPFSSSTLVLAEYVKNGKLILTRPTGNGDGGFYFDKLIKYKENSEYIVHFYMTCTKGTVENIHFHNGQNLNSTRIYIDDIYVGNIGNVINTSVFDDGLSHKVRMEYTTPSTLVDSSAGVNQTYFQPNKMLSNNTYTVIIEEFMVEEGTKASSWTPAPEDVDLAIDKKANIVDVYKKSETYSKTETDSKINVAKDSINLGVSQTYETKTNVTSKVNTAKTEAVATSKSYADTKKTEAINSANATTTEKLKSYSTTAQMNSAIQVAKDSITNTVSSTYAKKADVESTYATKSSLTQTANNITASFKASGGYNLVKNSNFKNGLSNWYTDNIDTTGTSKSITYWTDSNQYILPDTNAVVIRGTNLTERYGVSQTIKIKRGQKYTVSALSASHRGKTIRITVRNANGGGHILNVVSTNLASAGKNIANWNKMEGVFTAPTDSDTITLCLYMDCSGSDGYVWFTQLMINEGDVKQPWSPHPDEVYNGSTIIDASGITINNGALTVKNNSGTTVLSGDSNGNLDITGTVKSQKGNMYVSLDYGGLTFQSAHNKEQLLRMETTAFTSNKDINGVDLNLAKQGEYISFNHINKENLNNGWSSSDGRYNFVDFWSKDTTLGSKTYKKGINVNSPMYVNKGLKLYSGTNFYADIDGSISWNNGTGTVSNLLGLYGDNGAVLGYKSGESLNARFLVTEASQPGTGDNLISWGNYNFNGYTFHNANIVAKSLSVQGSKNCLQETNNYGSRLINAYETAEYYFGDIGFGQINEEGVCYIDIDDVFLECVNTDAQYHVFTQIYNGKITSIERYKTYFIVKGEPNTEFSWELKAKRKGYENNRLDTQLIDIDTVDSGLELFTDSDLNAITSENILTNVLDFNLENILLMEE